MDNIATIVPNCLNREQKSLLKKAKESILNAYKNNELITICTHGWKEYLEGKIELLEHLYKTDNGEEIGIWLYPPVKLYEKWSHGICKDHIHDIIQGVEIPDKSLLELELNNTRYMCKGCLDYACIINPAYIELND